ncbi:helix-turn-helix domain-containing GNAT family N-acetyltransferase [Actinophytocola sp.]|uniref:bifunctional helix-turn-helix transcriptional regulator/GNAT family N-acetyltransferase n=1 Tax=Actinophytocola sp. TaxID=1872138 RepID=UPI0025BF1B29|nr:helix-turn-helix domain-containing GNAT family N-acetyltransferase [Actinophytocola sp.]
MSRPLRSPEAAGLVTVAASDDDRRVRVAELTKAGLRERAELDDRADQAAASLLEPLDANQRRRLVTAMKEVDRMLTAALVTITPVPDHEHARYCGDFYFAAFDRRFEQGFDPARGISAEGDRLRQPAGLLLVADLRGSPVGCGALRFTPGEPAQLTRMWVTDEARGLGIGRRLLGELESRAAANGCDTARLETSQSLTEAIEPFNDEYHAHHWFTKRL